jgi:hypothetical protein
LDRPDRVAVDRDGSGGDALEDDFQ